ncbi:MAG: Calx-beta domain-containing protein, partial [Coleofasciculaceae cyanobacterium]
ETDSGDDLDNEDDTPDSDDDSTPPVEDNGETDSGDDLDNEDNTPDSYDDSQEEPEITPTGTFEFSQGNYSVNEDDGTVTITVERAGESNGEISLDYATSDGTATASSDYDAASGTLSFGDGETTKTFTIKINNDSDVEGDETVQLQITNVSAGNLGGQDEATLTIVNDDIVNNQALSASIKGSNIKFNSGDSEAKIAATGAAKINLGTQTIYIGTQQVSSNNQNPIIASFDSSNPDNNWVKTDYEKTGADGRGYGLFWTGSDLYGVFSVDGTQGSSSEDFRRASGDATQSWLKSFGKGGGAKVAVLAKINPATGQMTDAAYLSALLSNGNSNSLAITDLSVNGNGNLVVNAQSFFSPRNPDGSAMTKVGSGGSPFDYTIEITPNLNTVVSTSAKGWVA